MNNPKVKPEKPRCLGSVCMRLLYSLIRMLRAQADNKKINETIALSREALHKGAVVHSGDISTVTDSASVTEFVSPHYDD